MNNKFLDKVVDQILSETSIIDDKLHTPFLPSVFLFLSSPRCPSSLPPSLLSPLSPSFFSSHCKEIYSLNDKETDYVWEKYKKEVTTLINDMELTHQEK